MISRDFQGFIKKSFNCSHKMRFISNDRIKKPSVIKKVDFKKAFKVTFNQL